MGIISVVVQGFMGRDFIYWVVNQIAENVIKNRILPDENGILSKRMKTHLTVFDRSILFFFHPIFSKKIKNEKVDLVFSSGTEWENPVLFSGLPIKLCGYHFRSPLCFSLHVC